MAPGWEQASAWEQAGTWHLRYPAKADERLWGVQALKTACGLGKAARVAVKGNPATATAWRGGEGEQDATQGEGWTPYWLLAEIWFSMPSHCGASGGNSCGKELAAVGRSVGNTTVGPKGWLFVRGEDVAPGSPRQTRKEGCRDGTEKQKTEIVEWSSREGCCKRSTGGVGGLVWGGAKGQAKKDGTVLRGAGVRRGLRGWGGFWEWGRGGRAVLELLGLGKWRMIEVLEGKVKVHQNHEDYLSFSATSVLQDRCCKGQKSIQCPPRVSHTGLRHCSCMFFPDPPKPPQLGKLLAQGNSQRQGAVHVAAGQEDRAGQHWGETVLHLRASASQPISFRNASTPPTFWPGTEPYVCSL